MKNKKNLLLALLCFIFVGTIYYFDEIKNPAQPQKSPKFIQKQSLSTGDTVVIDNKAILKPIKTCFKSNLNEYTSQMNNARIISPENREKNCFAILKLEINTVSDINVDEEFLSGVITPNGKYYSANTKVAGELGKIPEDSSQTIDSDKSRILYFYTELPRDIVQKGGDFQFIFVINKTKYTIMFDPMTYDNVLNPGDVFGDDNYSMTIVATNTGKNIIASNDPETKFSRIPGHGFVEIVADVTNYSESKENILYYIKCHKIAPDGIEGITCEGLMESDDMNFFVSSGLGGSAVSGGSRIYSAEGAINNTFIKTGETRRIHFFWNIDDGDSSEYTLSVNIGGNQGYVFVDAK